jgi:hypothetical protein
LEAASFWGRASGSSSWCTFSNARPAPDYFKTRRGETIAKLTIRVSAPSYSSSKAMDPINYGVARTSFRYRPAGHHGKQASSPDIAIRTSESEGFRKGDTILIETRKKRFLYTVSITKIVSPGDTSSLRPPTTLS